MYGSSLHGSAESRVEQHARDPRYRESPRVTTTAARSTAYGAVESMKAVSAYLKPSRNNSSSGRDHHNAMSREPHGVGGKSPLRMALQGGGIRPRWSTSSEIIPEEMQKRREKLTERSSAYRCNEISAGTSSSRDFQAPNQPYDPSQATRPLSVRQRQAGFSSFQPSSGLGSVFPARRRASAFRDDDSEWWRASDAREELGPDPAKGRVRSSTQGKTVVPSTLNCHELIKKGGEGGGGYEEKGANGNMSIRGNNQTEEQDFHETTVERFGSLSKVSARVAPSPSSRLGLETDLQPHGHVSRRGRRGGVLEQERLDCGTPVRVSGGLGAASDVSGSSSGETFGDRSLRSGGSGGGGCAKPSVPLVVSSANEVERLLSIEGQEMAVGRRRYQTPGSSENQHPRASEEQYRREACFSEETSGQKSNRRNHSSEDKATGVGSERPGAKPISGERKASGNSHGLGKVRHGINANTSVPKTRGDGSSSGVDPARSFSVRRAFLVGLQNLGNTCFMNACLQCLLHTDALVDVFRRRVHEQRTSQKSRTQGALAAAFGELVRLIEASPAYSIISPTQEFLRFFLDGLSEDLCRRDSVTTAATAAESHYKAGTRRRSSPSPALSEEVLATLPADQQADRAWALHLDRNDSEVTRVFSGQLHSRISCLACGNISHCFDPFFDLSLPLPRGKDGTRGDGCFLRGSSGGFKTGLENNTRSSPSAASQCKLEDCLQAFTAKEMLDGDNRPVCTRCRRRRKSSKSLAVHRFPPVLVIHLKRFHYDSTSREKLATSVDFPISTRLNLAPFTTSWALPSSAGELLSHQQPNGHGVKDHEYTTSLTSPMYELYAVCNHTGGLEGGHYTAHCRGQKWHTFDDTRVSDLHSGQLEGASAYVLFYRLINSR